jgi:hypothetical protein
MNQITSAVAHFQTDNRRLPGYFSAKDMGSQENAGTYGFSAMQNVVLDLAGFKEDASVPTMYGPTAAAQVHFDPKNIGLPGEGNTKAYWIPDTKHFVVQDGMGQQVPPSSNWQLPSVVDEWGQPYLVWAQDDTVGGKVKTIDRFAAVDSSGNTPSLFYWASNSCFLKSDNFGRKGQNNNTDSLIGGSANTGDIPKSLAGMLGSPNSPYKDPNNTQPIPYDVPASPRAPFIVQSAGADGVFVGRKDRGGKQFASGWIDYRYSFAPDVSGPISATNQWTDANGRPTNIDVMEKFDDLLSGGGN